MRVGTVNISWSLDFLIFNFYFYKNLSRQRKNNVEHLLICWSPVSMKSIFVAITGHLRVWSYVPSTCKSLIYSSTPSWHSFMAYYPAQIGLLAEPFYNCWCPEMRYKRTLIWIDRPSVLTIPPLIFFRASWTLIYVTLQQSTAICAPCLIFIWVTSFVILVEI